MQTNKFTKIDLLNGHKIQMAPKLLRCLSLAAAAVLLLALAPVVGSPSPLPAGVRSVRGEAANHIYLPAIYKASAQIEWTLHKTPDGLHPNGSEQQMLWLMNRARTNPPQEGLWLATTAESAIASSRDYFDVDLGILQSEFNGYSAKPPAAFDARMYAGSKAHSYDLIARDAQDHDGQFDRIAAAGFECWGGRASVFSYASSALHAHGAFNIDWGFGTPDGMQDGRGHRAAIMSLDGDYTNVGIAMVPAPEGLSVGPLVTSAAYCYASESTPDHYNRFIVGTVWQDGNGNGRYDPGEGYGNVSVTPDHGRFMAVTGASGGYAIPVETPGTYRLSFSGPASGTAQVTVGAASVLADLLVPGHSAGPLEAAGEMDLPEAQPFTPAPPPQ